VNEPQVSTTVQADDVGARADVVLGRRVPGLSRRVARRLALAGRLRIDGRRARPSDRVDLGQRLTLDLPVRDPVEHAPTVLAVTDSFVYVDKPVHVHTVALAPGDASSLAFRVTRLHPECAEASPDPREGGAVHRLDHDTSGVVAFARSRSAWTQARSAFEAGRVGKRYLAICEDAGGLGFPPRAPADALPGWVEPCAALGEPVELAVLAPSGTGGDLALRVRAPLGRGPERGRMAVRLDGQGATTLVHARSLRSGAGPGLVCELELLTGRRHQARVHLAWLGIPIVGDAVYGAASEPTARRLHLHAVRLDLSAGCPGETPVTAPVDDGLFFA
jgi:23S rRNA pseudouridine1911/1915/1917 synthase